MASKYSKVKFPLWSFLKQPLFSLKRKAILNPHRFWYLYRIELLENCLTKKCDSKESSL